MPDQKKWVIIFLIYADFVESVGNNEPGFNLAYAEELDRFLLTLLKTSFSPDKIDLYVVYGSLNFEELEEGSSQKIIVSSSYLFKLLPGKKINRVKFLKPLGKEIVNENTASGLGTFKLQRSETLTKILNDIKNRYTKPENISVMLTTWDHGAAFGVFGSVKPITFLSSLPLPGSSTLPTIAKFIEKIPADVITQLKKSKKSGHKNRFLYKNKVYSSAYSDFIKKNIDTISGNIEKGLLKTEIVNNSFTIKCSYDLKLLEDNPYNFTNLWGNTPMPGLFSNFEETGSATALEITSELEGLLEILTTEELSLAIQNSFGKVDILVMMNCWMMNLHCLYSMRGCVDFLVAPQGGISEPGYDFIKIIAEINKSNLTTEGIANLCVDISCDFSAPGRNDKEKIKEIRNWALMVAKISGNQPLIEKDIPDLINNIADIMLQNGIGTDLKKQLYLQYMSKLCYIFSNDNGIRFFQLDLLNWLKLIERHNTPVAGGRNILRNFFLSHSRKLNELITNIFIGEKSHLDGSYDFRIKNDTFSFLGIALFPPSGTSIYLPFIVNDQELAHKLYISNTSEMEKDLKLSNRIGKWTLFLKDLSVSIP